jgi:hypothetical protein
MRGEPRQPRRVGFVKQVSIRIDRIYVGGDDRMLAAHKTTAFGEI